MMIVNPYRTDGFGAQLQTIIYSIVYAEFNNYKFSYVPFITMAHNYNNDPFFLLKKELLINFIFNFNVSYNAEYQLTQSVQNNITMIEIFTKFFESDIEKHYNSKSIKFIKDVIKKDKISPFSSKNIVIHIRRQNIHDTRTEGTDVSNDIYNELITKLMILYPDHKVHIYSQEIFETNLNVIQHINESIEDTFKAFIFADILVTAPSSFSYIGAMLNDNLVYYIVCLHPPMKHWINITTLLKKSSGC